eukprot:487321_1
MSVIMSLKYTLFVVIYYSTVINCEEMNSINGYCDLSGLQCMSNSDCNDSECIPLSYYKELSNKNTSELCEEDILSDYPILYLPRINLQAYKEGNKKEKQKLIQLFDEYLHTFSTVSLYNHGIEDEEIEKLLMNAKKFFDRPLQYKMQYKTNVVGNSGYDKWKFVSAARSYGIHDQPFDLTASFARYNHDGINGEYGPLNCPDYLLNISNIYISKIFDVLHTVYEISALALELPINYFNNLHQTDPVYHLRLWHYPSLNLSNIEERAMRISDHTDFLGFNIYIPGQTRGLQMKISDDLWFDIKTKSKYDLVINIGQLISIWTNNYWKATIHKVIPASKERFTISFFTGPDQQTLIQQIKQCPKCMKKKAIFVPIKMKDHAKITYSSSMVYDSDSDTFYS